MKVLIEQRGPQGRPRVLLWDKLTTGMSQSRVLSGREKRTDSLCSSALLFSVSLRFWG